LRALGENVGLSSLAPSISLAQEFTIQLRSVQLVSFDLFDTLVERVVSEPTEVFRIAAIKVGCYDPELFRAKRIQAETLARKSSKHSEVTLDEIYNELAILTGFDANEISRFKNEEISTEMSILRPRPIGQAMFDAACKAGIPIVISSDIYLPEDAVKNILNKNGYAGWVDLLVSSKLRRTKHEGGLFHALQQKHNISADKILHVGDNAHSDDLMPRRLGFLSYQIRRTWDEFQADVRRQAAWPEKDGISVLPSILRGLVARQFGLASAASNHTEGWLGNPHLIGYATLGPVLIGFCTWLASSAQARGKKTLWFLSRDGFYLKAAYDLLAAAHPEWPRSRYVAASRALCWAAIADSPDRVMEVARVDHFPMAICDLLKNRFGYTSKDVDKIPDDFFNSSGLSSRQTVVNQEDPAKFKFIEMIAPEIIRRSAIAREDYRSYLTGLDCPHTAAVVDIGYSGSSQKVISRLLETKVDGFYMITSERAASLSSEGLFADAWIAQHAPLDHPFFQKVQLWELLLSGTHGSVIGTPNGNSFILDDNILDEESRAYLSLIHKGAIDLVNVVITNFGTKLIEPLSAVEATHPLNEWFKNPAACDVIPLRRIIFEDRFGGDVRALIVPTRESKSMMHNKSLGLWKEAALACSNEESIVTPFWPAGPVACARSIGLLQAGDDSFIDKTTPEGDITLASCCLDFNNVFDSIGNPHKISTKPIHLLLPIEAIDTRFKVVVASLKNQFSPGFLIHAAVYPGVDRNQALDILGSVESCREVASVSDMKDIVADLPFDDILVLHDGRSVVAHSAAIELLVASQHGDADLISVDEDELIDNNRVNPHFKPKWSPDMLRSTDYLGGFWAVKVCNLNEINPKSATVRGWMWEISIGLVDRIKTPFHIPRILSSRDSAWDKLHADSVQVDAQRAVLEKFASEGHLIEVQRPEWSIHIGKPVVQPVFADQGPRVAIIIPTHNGLPIIKRCIESLLTTTYKKYSIYIIDNDSDDIEMLDWLAQLNDSRLHVLRISSPATGFSYSYINNRAVEQTKGEELLLFLNNDTAVIEPRWLSQMVGWQSINGVGSVGGLLFYENELVQHAGITHRLLYNVLPAPSLKLVPRGERGYQNYLCIARNSAAQTAACLLTPRSVFVSQGGFDEKDFSVAYNDCDYGFKLINEGYRNVYCPDAVLYHYEGLSRGRGIGNDKPEEEAAFIRKYADWSDPYYNPNLATGVTDFSTRPVSAVTTSIPQIRLAVITHNLNFEGAPLVLMELARGLIAEGLPPPVVITLQDGPLKSVYEKFGAEIVVLDSLNFFTPSKEHYAASISKVAEVFSAHSIGVVFANTVLSWWAVDAAQKIGIPSIWFIHESEPPFTHLKEHGSELVNRGKACLDYAYRVVFPSWETQRVWQKHEKFNNFQTIHNGFDKLDYEQRSSGLEREEVRASLHFSEEDIVGIVPGSVCERKSQLDILEAVKLLDSSIINNLRILIIGDRPSAYSKNLHLRYAALNHMQQKAISILPYCKDMEKYYKAADFMISASRIEAFPKVVQEGMFYSLPMILAPVFGIIEQVQDEVSALFFSPGDSKKLAEQISRICRDSKLRMKLAQNARVSLNRLPSMRDMVRDYKNIISEAWIS